MTRNDLQLSTDKKKLIYCFKTLAFSDGTSPKEQRNQVIGVLKAGYTVNDIVHHFGCSRQTIHNLMNRYTSTGSVRVRARPARARVTTLRPHRVNTLTHLDNRFNHQPLLLGVHAQKIINHFLQNNGPGIFQHYNARPHTSHK